MATKKTLLHRKLLHPPKTPLAESLVFRMYSQELHKWTGPSTLEYHLGKVCGKNYLNDESLLNKICGLKKFTLKTILVGYSRNLGFSNV